MRRRDFIRLVGGAAAWPAVAQGQPRDRTRRVGVLMGTAEHDPNTWARLDPMRDALRALGWIEGQNVRFEYRWPEAKAELVKAYAAELVASAPDVILVGLTAGAQALQRETRSLPIVFVNIADPVGGGIIPSLAKPGGNITGFTAFEYATAGKWLELLKEIAPSTTRAAFIYGGPEIGRTGEGFYRALAAVAPALSVQLVPIQVPHPGYDIAPAINEFAATGGGGLIAAAEPGGSLTRATSIRLAAQHRLPAVYPFRFYATEGGLAVYGIDLPDQYRRVATYLDRILRGAKPADLPVQAPDKFELIINLKTARAAGIDIPPALLARADEVIE
jgi:putative ABC transport system substrate-binding protein